jgi:hypothetical protein
MHRLVRLARDASSSFKRVGDILDGITTVGASASRTPSCRVAIGVVRMTPSSTITLSSRRAAADNTVATRDASQPEMLPDPGDLVLTAVRSMRPAHASPDSTSKEFA